MTHEYGEYKGHKLLKLFDANDSRFPFSFGKKKAKLIMANLDAVRQFAEG